MQINIKSPNTQKFLITEVIYGYMFVIKFNELVNHSVNLRFSKRNFFQDPTSECMILERKKKRSGNNFLRKIDNV